MSNVDLNSKELTYLLIALRKYEESLLGDDSEEMEDSVTDLLSTQALIKKLKEVKG